MKKKIFSIGMVKNNDDIIESHVRYHLNILDGMIILDNGSTDDTFKILKLLKSEGLHLHIIKDKDREYAQVIKTNQLLLAAVNEFNADIIIPLDADEFIISDRTGNPREILDKIEPQNYYKARWKTYVPHFPNNREKFVPARIIMARDDSLEEFYKVILSKDLINDYDVRLLKGNHDITYDSNFEIMETINNDLRIAHFPIRSKEQLWSKILVSWIYNLSRPDRVEGDSYHQQIIFNKLKQNEDISYDDVTNFAKRFAINSEVEVNIREDPIDLTFCEDINIKYTPDKVRSISNILESMEWLALDYANFKKNSITREKELNDKIDDLFLELDELTNEKIYREKLLKEKIIEYEKSTSWIITAPLREIKNLLWKK